MAVTLVDSYSEEFANSTGFTTSSGPNFTGTNRRGCVIWTAGGGYSGISLVVTRDPGGNDESYTDEVNATSGAGGGAAAFSSDTEPATGIDTYNIDWSDTAVRTGGVAIYAMSGVDQTTPVAATAFDDSVSGDPSVTISASAGQLTMDGTGTQYDSLTAGGSQTAVLDTDVAGDACGSSHLADAVSAMSWTTSGGGTRWAQVAIVFGEAAGGGGGATEFPFRRYYQNTGAGV